MSRRSSRHEHCFQGIALHVHPSRECAPTEPAAATMHKLLIPLLLALTAACTSDDYEGDASAQDDVGQGSSITEGQNQTDAEHLALIREALFVDDSLSPAAKSVTVLVESGAVTLSGEVPTTAERARVEEIVEDCIGTTSVDNQISVEPR